MGKNEQGEDRVCSFNVDNMGLHPEVQDPLLETRDAVMGLVSMMQRYIDSEVFNIRKQSHIEAFVGVILRELEKMKL